MTDILDELRDRRKVAYSVLRERAALEIERLREQNRQLEHWQDVAVKRGAAIVSSFGLECSCAQTSGACYICSDAPVTTNPTTAGQEP